MNPVAKPMVKRPKPSQSKRELATTKVWIGGKRKNTDDGRRVFSWRSWMRYIRPARPARANAPQATIENEVCASSQGLIGCLTGTDPDSGWSKAQMLSTPAKGVVNTPRSDRRQEEPIK